MKIAVVTANLGGFEKRQQQHIEQSIPCDFYYFDDYNFPPRHASMTPRLQARIVKMFMWQMIPNYDYYLWVDSSMDITHTDTVKWFLDMLDSHDIVVFKHPHRNTVGEEATYLKERLVKKCPYITPRYENELIDEQLQEVMSQMPLYASTAFMYKSSVGVELAMKEWWYHTSRYHSIDQLSFSTALSYAGLHVQVIKENYLKIPYLTYVRNK